MNQGTKSQFAQPAALPRVCRPPCPVSATAFRVLLGLRHSGQARAENFVAVFNRHDDCFVALATNCLVFMGLSDMLAHVASVSTFR